MEITNLAVLKGKTIEINEGKIKFSPPKQDATELNETLELSNGEKVKVPASIVRSDVSFSNGVIEFNLKAQEADTGVLVIFKTNDGNELVCGVSRSFKGFVIGVGNRKFTPVVKSGSLENYKKNSVVHFKIEVVGSSVRLFINNVLLCESQGNIKESPIEFRMNSSGVFEIYDIKVQKQKPKIFIVMQFSQEYNELYEEVILPVANDFGFECVRADEFYTSTPIIKDIVDSILQSVAIIAEITPDNPNVFYEIGYSHAIGKPTILLCDRKREKLPFDISSFRTLFYENTIAGKKKVENNLRKYLDNL